MRADVPIHTETAYLREGEAMTKGSRPIESAGGIRSRKTRSRTIPSASVIITAKGSGRIQRLLTTPVSAVRTQTRGK